MSDANHFPLFDPNAEAHNSGNYSAARFSSACEDAEARERLSAMYLSQMESDAAPVSADTPAAPAAETRPEGLDSLLARASEESAAQASAAAAPVAEPVVEATAERAPEQIEAERMVAEALAAVNAGTQSDVPVNADVEARMAAVAAEEAKEEADTQEFVHEIQQEVAVAEISAAAEEFVAEQTGHVAPKLENVEPHATCGSLPEAAESFASEIASKDTAAMQNATAAIEPAIPEVSLKSETPWEPIAEAAKRYDLAEPKTEKPLAQAAAAGASAVSAASATPAKESSNRAKGSTFTSRLKNFWGDSSQPSLTAAIGSAMPSARAESNVAAVVPAVDAQSTLHATASDVQEFVETVAKQIPVAPPKISEPEPAAAETRAASQAASAKPAVPLQAERRRKRRALISAPLRVRTKNLTGQGLDEVATTVDVSRLGVLFHTSLDCYMRGMELAVTFPYSKIPHGIQAEQMGTVARIQDLGDGRRAVAVMLGVVPGQHVVDTYGRKLANTPVHLTASKTAFAENGMLAEKLTGLDVKKPVVLAVDADLAVRDSLRGCLEKEGYEVIAMSSAKEARQLLDILTPALIIAEVEGEGLPGYDLCAHVKQTPRLRHIPVVLTTGSAYPSDYSNAHSLGAVVCMAKPYKLERITHIARLLAPPPSTQQNQCTPRAGDPSRIPGRDSGVMVRNGNGAAKKAAPAKNGNAKSGVSIGNGKGIFKFPTFR